MCRHFRVTHGQSAPLLSIHAHSRTRSGRRQPAGTGAQGFFGKRKARRLKKCYFCPAAAAAAPSRATGKPPHTGPAGTRAAASQTVKMNKDLKLEYLGFIYNDPLVPHAVLRQKPFVVVDPKGKPSICMRHIVSRLEKLDFDASEGFGRFVRKLFGRKWD